MSNPTVSFRISDYHLARGLRAIRTIEPAWQLTTPSDLIRTIFNDYIAKSEHIHNSSLDVTAELLQEIVYSRAGISKQRTPNDIMPQLGTGKPETQKSAQQRARELEEDKLFNDMKRESLAKAETKPQTEIEKSTETLDTQISLAQINKLSKTKPSEFHDPNITESDINSVTDFNPPEEWKEDKSEDK